MVKPEALLAIETSLAFIITMLVIYMKQALETAVAEYEVSINGPMKWQTLSSFLKKRFSRYVYITLLVYLNMFGLQGKN